MKRACEAHDLLYQPWYGWRFKAQAIIGSRFLSYLKLVKISRVRVHILQNTSILFPSSEGTVVHYLVVTWKRISYPKSYTLKLCPVAVGKRDVKSVP